MPFLFSYGTLQHEPLQLKTFGRRIAGRRDALPGYEPSLVPIDNPQVVAALGRTHNANVTPNGDERSCVTGTVLEVTEEELAQADEYEIAFHYRRVMVQLASGTPAWIYVHP